MKRRYLVSFVVIALLLIFFGNSDVKALSINDFRSPVATNYRLNQGPERGHNPINSIDVGPYPIGGWDIPIYASASGIVTNVGWDNSGYGNRIIIDHGQGWSTLYAHLSGFSVAHLEPNGSIQYKQEDAVFVVSEDQYVQSGQLIAFMGNTGTETTNVHLHFEINSSSYSRWQLAEKMKSLSWIEMNNVGLYTDGVYGQPVHDPACNDRAYSGVDFLYSPYCQDGSARYFNSAGQREVNLWDVDSIYVASGWSVYVWANDGSGQCINRSLWDLRKDFYPTGASIHNNIKLVNVHNNATCGGMVDPYIPDDPTNQLPGTGGGGDPTGYLEIFDTVNYSGKISNLSVGTHYFNINTLMFSFQLQGAGSFIVHAPDGRNKCFNSSVPNMQDFSEYWRETIKVVVYPGDVCSPATGGGSNDGYVEIFHAERYSNKMGDYNTGTHGFNIDTLMFSFRMKDGAKSFVVHAPDGRSKCFNEDVPDMRSYSEYWRETIRLDVHANDVCTSEPSRPDYKQVELWSQIGFNGTRVTHVDLGLSNEPASNSYSLNFPDGWSVITYSSDDRTGEKKCWESSVSNLADYGWHNKIESMDPHNYNVCPEINAPTGLKVINYDHHSAELIWQDNSDNENHFFLYILHADTDEIKNIYGFASNSKSGVIGTGSSRLFCEQEYKIYVIAKNLNDQIESDHSNWVRIKMADCPLIQEPDRLSASNSTVYSAMTHISWRDNSDNEDYFKFWFLEEGSDTWESKIVYDSSLTLADVSCEINFDFEVWAVNDEAIAKSERISHTTGECDSDGITPTKATNLEVTFNGRNAIISWNDNSKIEDHYDVRWSFFNESSNLGWDDLPANTTEYVIENLDGGIYEFSVDAVNMHEGRTYKGYAKITFEVITETPNMPTNLSKLVPTETSIGIRWDDNSNNENWFEVWYRKNGGVWSNNQVAENITSKTIEDLSCGSDYEVLIRAVRQANGFIYYSESSSVIVETAVCVPLAPSNVNVETTKTTATVIWQDNSDNESFFNIRVLKDGFGIDHEILFSDNTSVVFENLQCEKQYEFFVEASNNSGRSRSESVFKYTANCYDGENPHTPTNLHVVETTKETISVAWEDNSEVENYYKFWFQEVGTDLWRFQILPADTTNNTINNLSCGKKYYVAVEVQGDEILGNAISDWLTISTISCNDSEYSLYLPLINK